MQCSLLRRYLRIRVYALHMTTMNAANVHGRNNVRLLEGFLDQAQTLHRHRLQLQLRLDEIVTHDPRQQALLKC